jgi:hypothetical protein
MLSVGNAECRILDVLLDVVILSVVMLSAML